jgi:hypothetical protein
MRGFVSGILVVAAVGIVFGLLWWNWARVETWVENTGRQRAREQDRQRVRNAEVFLEKGLAELDQEISRLERARYEHRVCAEEAHLRAGKQQNSMAEAEQLAVEFPLSQTCSTACVMPALNPSREKTIGSRVPASPPPSSVGGRTASGCGGTATPGAGVTGCGCGVDDCGLTGRKAT